MRAAGELAALIAQEAAPAPTMETETRLVKLAHKYYCTVSEIRTECSLAASEDEAISRIYLKLAQAEAKRADDKLHLSTAYGKLTATEKEI